MNPYINYYVNQAVSGIGGFQGARFQRGQGFFGNVFKNAILPLIKYLGKRAISAGADVAVDAINGENLVNSLKSRGTSAAQNIADDFSKIATRFAQSGQGRKRRRRKTRKHSNNNKTFKKNRRKSKKIRIANPTDLFI